MKKLILSILLVASASSNLLLAQSECDQVTGYRLQVTGINQTLDNRLQIANNNEKVLPSEDQMGQGAEITTNYELRTTNCNNQGRNNLDCYLMMNPSLEGAEKELEKLVVSEAKLSQVSSSARLDVTTSVENTTAFSLPSIAISVTRSSNQHIDQPTASIRSVGRIVSSVQRGEEKNEHLEKTARMTYFLSEASRCLAEVSKRNNSGNKEDLFEWHKSAEYNKAAADSMRSSLDRLEKASEASKIGNHPLSTLWRKTAEQYQSAAEYYRKSAEAYETDCIEDDANDCTKDCTEDGMEDGMEDYYTENRREKNGWKEGQRFGGDWEGLDSGFEFNSGCGRRALQGAFQLEKAVECVEKTISAEKKENQPLSDLWNEAAEQYQVTADYSSRHAEALASSSHFTGDKNADQLMREAHAAWKIAQQLEYAATSLEKAMNNNDQPLADLWRKAAEQNQVAVEYGRKHAETFALKSAKASVSKKENPRFYETRDAAASSAKRLNQAAIAFDKSCQAEKIGNQTLANLWRKSFEQNQLAVECHKRDVEAFQGQGSFSVKRGVNYIESRADQFRDAAISLERAIKAEENNNLFPQSTEAAKGFVTPVLESSGMPYTFRALRSEAPCSSSASATLKTGSNDQSLAALWKKSSEQWQAAAEYMGQALEFYEQGSHDYCNNRVLSKLAYADEVQGVDGAQKLSVQELLDASSTGATQQLAAEVEFRKNSTVSGSEAWVLQCKKAGEFLPKADHFDHIGRSAWSSALQFKKAAELLEKAIEVEKKGDQSIAALYRKASSLSQAAAEYKIKDKEAYLQRSEPVDYNKRTCFYYAAESLKNGADQVEEAVVLLEKAIKAEQADNQYLSTLYRKAADFYQASAECSQNASDAYTQKNTNLSSQSTEAANGFVAPVLEASSSSCTLNFCAPWTPCPSSPSANSKTGSKIGTESFAKSDDWLSTSLYSFSFITLPSMFWKLQP